MNIEVIKWVGIIFIYWKTESVQSWLTERGTKTRRRFGQHRSGRGRCGGIQPDRPDAFINRKSIDYRSLHCHRLRGRRFRQTPRKRAHWQQNGRFPSCLRRCRIGWLRLVRLFPLRIYIGERWKFTMKWSRVCRLSFFNKCSFFHSYQNLSWFR